jgi:hypothetical protein
MRRAVPFVLAALLVPNLHAGSAQNAVRLPGWLDEYVTKAVKLPAADRSQLLSGSPVTQMMESNPSNEVAVFGAVWVSAPIARYVAAVNDIEQMEKGENFRVTKKISSPPQIEDFAALKLPPEDLDDLRTCRVGSCELKLSEGTIKRLRSEIDWSKATATSDVEQLARRLMLDYVNGYLEGGNARLATYRDSSRPTFVAQEFSSMIDRMPSLVVYLPDLRKYLLDYPKATLAKSTSFLYWQEAKFGLKPTIRINHLTLAEEATHTAVVSKMLYASHYFWTALELRVLVPDPARGAGFWFVSVNRSRSDGLSGFVGSLIRGKVRGEAEKGMQALLAVTKANMERAPLQARQSQGSTSEWPRRGLGERLSLP